MLKHCSTLHLSVKSSLTSKKVQNQILFLNKFSAIARHNNLEIKHLRTHKIKYVPTHKHIYP